MRSFGLEHSRGEIDDAKLVKPYDDGPFGRRFNPGICTGARKPGMMSQSALTHISTSYAERQKLTMRIFVSRFTRLADALGRKSES